jgi:hypothetical protein
MVSEILSSHEQFLVFIKNGHEDWRYGSSGRAPALQA